MWPFKKAQVEKVAQPKRKRKYRIVKLTDGKFYPQFWGGMYGDEPKWLTIGAIGTNEVTQWLYPSDELGLQSEKECEEKMRQYEKDYALKYGTDEAIVYKREL